jgi:hypothetical protein
MALFFKTFLCKNAGIMSFFFQFLYDLTFLWLDFQFFSDKTRNEQNNKTKKKNEKM